MYRKKITGRLGNQMFQYASMLGIKETCDIDSDIYLSFEMVYERGFTNDLKMFNTSFKEVDKINISKVQKLFFYTERIIEEIIKKIYKNDLTKSELKLQKLQSKTMKLLARRGILNYSKGFYDYSKIKDIIKKDDIYITGFLESAKYFDNVRDKILEEFTPREEKLAHNKELYDAIENSESVCITIRRGDFLDSKFKSEHFVCDSEYFYRGIEIIKSKVKNPRFVVFSDDVEWCKENMKFPAKTLYESGNDPVWEKLRLMYSCKHFIISNSTFSWWAQYLSRNNDKIVIAPSKWKNVGINDDIYQDNWIKI